MKKAFSSLIVLALILCISQGLSFAEATNTPEAVPANASAAYLGSRSIGGTETSGVTFAISEVSYDYDTDTLQISVLQLPNDEYTSLMDNQVDYANDKSHLDNQIAIAAEYGDTVLGTLCDILTITDENGGNLFDEYRVSGERYGSAMDTIFHIFLPQENTIKEITVELTFGVNEDLSAHFPASESMVIKYAHPAAPGSEPIVTVD